MDYAHEVSKEKDDSPRGCVPKAIRLTMGVYPSHAINRLCDDAAAARGPLSIGIDGYCVDGLRVGGVGCEGEEGSEGVHCCVCVWGVWGLTSV
jgi:hypothetical protein